MGGPDDGGMHTVGDHGFSPPAFLQRVFPPKVVMQHQEEIGLTREQADAIKKDMNDTQQRLTDLQWKLDGSSEALDKMLSTDHVDEQAVLAKLDEVTTTEQEIKKTNFALLVRIKNHLDPAQQQKLRTLRASMPFGGFAGHPH
jgi:Spy/CpxP family protein refolding chaperone